MLELIDGLKRGVDRPSRSADSVIISTLIRSAIETAEDSGRNVRTNIFWYSDNTGWFIKFSMLFNKNGFEARKYFVRPSEYLFARHWPNR